MRKLINIWLILAYINTFLACSIKTTKGVQISDISLNDKDIAVILEDSAKYYFKSNMYGIKADVLEGQAVTKHGASMGLKTIVLSDIKKIELIEKTTDWGKVATAGFVVVMVAGIIYLIVSSSMSFFSAI